MAKSYTGVTFNGYHSWTNWGLRLKEIEIEVPEAKTKYKDIKGVDGDIDLTEYRNDGVKYEMRKIIFTFNYPRSTYINWMSLTSRIANIVEGKLLTITIDNDSDYYYTGRGHISTTKTNEVNSEIVIECNCQPMKTDGSTELI